MEKWNWIGDTLVQKFQYTYDSVGNIVEENLNDKVITKYTYDAWGNVLTATGEMANINPFRYRSYYYDSETWFYYLQSRYYDPAIGRFINADELDMLGADGSFLSYNLFSYCTNNPVNRFDATGNFGELALAGGGAIASGLSLSTIGTAIVSALGAITPVGWVVIGTVVVVAAGISVYQYSEHSTTKNGKKRNKHEKGNARRKRDQGGEKKKVKDNWKRRR